MLTFLIKQIANNVAIKYRSETISENSTKWLDLVLEMHGIEIDFWVFTGDFIGMVIMGPNKTTGVINSNSIVAKQDFMKAYILGKHYFKSSNPFCINESNNEPAGIFARELLSLELSSQLTYSWC